MTLYELIKQANDVLTPGTEKFYDYVINSSDNNGGFLRTCYHRHSKPLEDYKHCDDIAVVCFSKPFKEKDLDYDFSDLFGYQTRTKLQFVYSGGIEELEWNFQMDYRYCYIIKNGKYIKLEADTDKRLNEVVTVELPNDTSIDLYIDYSENSSSDSDKFIEKMNELVDKYLD
ncbi:MAG: hypothetical protein IJ593_09405 [Lachnospiraceae bacterium]|nr:hypothetical protein [Lachnospiraceae bacterium]